jgi:hypothetical protein
MCDTARATGGLSRQCCPSHWRTVSLMHTRPPACPLPCTRACQGAWQTACAWPSVRTSHPHVALNFARPQPQPQQHFDGASAEASAPPYQPVAERYAPRTERDPLLVSREMRHVSAAPTSTAGNPIVLSGASRLPASSACLHSAARVCGHLISVFAMMLAVTCAGEYSCHCHIAL